MNLEPILTPEEEKELAEINPKLLEELKSGSPIGRAWLASVQRSKELGELALEQAAEIREEVNKAASEQNSLMTWCGYPTDITRCSPFFPMNPKGLGHREYLKNFVITSANWGEITYTGPKLSTYEEDILMALLAILNSVSQYRQTTEVEGAKTYTYKGPVLPILKLLGHKNPGKTNYKHLLSGLENLTFAGVKLCVSSGKTKTGKRRDPKKIDMATMLTHVRWNEEEKELLVTVNPFFYEAYYAGTVTMIDVLKRVKLKGNIAKALYRFVQSHKKNPVFTGHFLTLAQALNMDIDRSGRKLRELLKIAINELIKHDILTKKSRFIEQDIITLERTQKTFPNNKNLCISKLE